jgi:DNA-binding transcriptional regulator GbsR (MarR family)
MSDERLQRDIITTFAEAYQNLGYSSLMGKIVALLLISEQPLSLDEISDKLEMSKGPVSQITRRLKDHQLIERVWVPGDRKDFYRASNDMFGEAFRNYVSSMKRNKQIAEKFLSDADLVNTTDFLKDRMKEMQAFYELMEKHNKLFIEEWAKIHDKYKRP